MHTGTTLWTGTYEEYVHLAYDPEHSHAWEYEGKGFNVYGIEHGQPIGTKPVQRLYKPSEGLFMWSADVTEILSLTTFHDWLYDGVAFYVPM